MATSLRCSAHRLSPRVSTLGTECTFFPRWHIPKAEAARSPMGSQAGRSIHGSAIRRKAEVDFVRETEKFFASSSKKVEVKETLGRSYLYVPATSDRMLEKSLTTTTTDVIVYDLEDSVPPSAADKTGARERLSTFLSGRVTDLPAHERIAVRVNALGTPFFAEDIKMAINLNCVRTLVLPKIHSAHDLRRVSEVVHQAYMDLRPHLRGPPIQLVASIESAKAVHRLGQIARWRTKLEHGGKLSALLFAAEDYCADTGVIRTTSRQELLYTRSYIAVTAKAFKLKAIDMVCVNYKDLDYLRDECEDGRRLGFTGKQAIHPTQVDVIQSTFVPSSKEILRAARILKQMEKAHQTNKGAAGLTLEGGGMEMIDAPMIKQAENVVRAARAAGLEIPDVE